MKEYFNVFVYGTLKPGQSNYYSMGLNKMNLEEIKGYVYGKLLDIGGLPGLTEGNNKIYGCLFKKVSLTLLRNFDLLEGYKFAGNPTNFYNRKPIKVFTENNEYLCEAEVYFINKSYVDKSEEIKDGIW